MGLLLMFFLMGAIPLLFLYLLFTNPKVIWNFFLGLVGFAFICAVGIGLFMGLLSWAASA